MVKKELAIGIDIGGTNTKFGLIDIEGNILHRGAIKTKNFPGINDFAAELANSLAPLIDDVGGHSAIKGIGIGAPNGNYYTGTIEFAPNLHWKGIIPMAEIISEKMNLPATLTNDANAAAMGEKKYGAARNMRDFIMLTLGTGVGSGIFINGQLVYGHDGFAGELGHNIIIPGGRYHPGTGSHGSLEMYASASGVVYTTKETLADNPDEPSLLRKYKEEEITSRIVYECAMQGDNLSHEIFHRTGEILGMAMANFAMFSSPEAFILFGGLVRAGDILFTPIKTSFEEHLLPIFKNKIKIIASQLYESDAAILGASAMVWD